jgi:hypothetical protein
MNTDYERREYMKIYDEIFTWDGWGGPLKLASGKCKLRIFDLKKGTNTRLAFLRPIIVIISDVPDSKMSIKSCSGHIATQITEKFNIEPNRMLFIEYYPEIRYGDQNQYVIKEKYEAVDFKWYNKKAIEPKWRPLKSPILDTIKELMTS